jgi:hypothetical protein
VFLVCYPNNLYLEKKIPIVSALQYFCMFSCPRLHDPTSVSILIPSIFHSLYYYFLLTSLSSQSILLLYYFNFLYISPFSSFTNIHYWYSTVYNTQPVIPNLQSYDIPHQRLKYQLPYINPSNQYCRWQMEDHGGDPQSRHTSRYVVPPSFKKLAIAE